MNRHQRARVRQSLITAPHLPIVAYLAVIGWLALASGGVAPHALVHTLPAWLVLMWSIAIAVGGTLATAGGLFGRTRLESSGLVLLLYGAVVYGTVLAVALWPGSLTTILVSAAVAAMCGMRMRVLALARHAQDVATQRLRHGQGD